MTEISTWLAEATADRLERVAAKACAHADEIEDIAIGLETFGIEPSDFEHFDDHPLVVLVNALCDLETASDLVYVNTDQQALLTEAALCLRGPC